MTFLLKNQVFSQLFLKVMGVCRIHTTNKNHVHMFDRTFFINLYLVH
jgi:hypothetical protein